VKGNFRIKGIRTTNPVSVGDWVAVTPTGDDFFISAVEPRRNYIIRRASNLSKESHILASNIDMAILVCSIKEPVTTTTFIDRFLATAEAYNIPAKLLINKEDLWDADDREYAEALKYLYTSIEYEVLFTSAATGEGMEALTALLKDKLSLLAGNSGVGKSSIINRLVPGANLRTGEISELYHTGTHTTTFSEMLMLPVGGAVIDVPGVKGFGVIDFDKFQVGHYFPEIFKHSSDCKYSDCRHRTEPGCAVVQALDQHLIAESRYASYLSILEEVEEQGEKYRKPF
jgi:ribosome biogenesis GTPase